MIGLDMWEQAIRNRVASALAGVKVTVGAMPATPDRVVTVKAYAGTVPASPDDLMRTIRMQVRARQSASAAIPTANADAETAQAALLGHHHNLIPGGPTARITHMSTAALGLDSQGRDERTDNYQITYMK